MLSIHETIKMLSIHETIKILSIHETIKMLLIHENINFYFYFHETWYMKQLKSYSFIKPL